MTKTVTKISIIKSYNTSNKNNKEYIYIEREILTAMFLLASLIYNINFIQHL